MSLQVWLPMTKDLRQQGLSSVTVTNNGATFNSSGKLGGCYYFDRSVPNYLKINNPLTSATNGVSMSFWVKLPSKGSVNDQLVHIGNGSGWANNRFTCFVRGNNSTLIFCCGDGAGTSTSTQYNCVSSALVLNQWTHVVCTYNSGKMKIYLNGVLDKEYITTIIPSFANVSYIGVGAGPNTTEPATAYLNDVRIYDHCLSPMEIKRISQGLVLHYPLNRMGFGQENLFKNSSLTNLTSSNLSTKIYYQGSYIPEITQNGLKFTWTGSSAREIDLWLDKTLKADTYYTLSFIYRNNMAIGSSFYLRKDGNLVGYWSQPTIPYSEDWSIYRCTFKIANYQSNDATTGTLLTLFYSGYTANKWIELKQNSIKLEEGSIATPWSPASSDDLAAQMGLNSNIEYDTSGYCNNGTKNNSPTYSSDTAKYEVSTHLDGNNQTIQLPNLTTLIPDSIFTFNIWFKRLEAEPSPRPWETLLGGPSGFEIETCSANNVHDNKIKAYSWGGGTIEFEFDKWNMLTMVSNGTNALFYLNGELKLTGTYKALVSGNYFIGSWSNTSTQNYKGYVCDARIYATALSADDVKSLYQNTATIDADGTIHGAVR